LMICRWHQDTWGFVGVIIIEICFHPNTIYSMARLEAIPGTRHIPVRANQIWRASRISSILSQDWREPCFYMVAVAGLRRNA
jgi:hypothetical protein